jgi:hypothetical protein
MWVVVGTVGREGHGKWKTWIEGEGVKGARQRVRGVGNQESGGDGNCGSKLLSNTEARHCPKYVCIVGCSCFQTVIRRNV